MRTLERATSRIVLTSKPDPDPLSRPDAPATHDTHRTVQEQLVFVISPPRAGSTLLQRMLGSHSEIFTHPEPHLIAPLAHLGYYANVDKAPFDHINSAVALQGFVDALPRRENDYLDALRAYADTLYGRMLTTTSCSFFLDKTPANALVLPFLRRLYPRAKYIVLTRHPLAVFSSYANSFFGGEWAEAHAYNPILERYVPAMAEFLRERPVPLLHITYEELVAAPAPQLERIFAFLGVEHEPEAVEYGRHDSGRSQGPGDPIAVHRHQRPTTESIDKWARELASDPAKKSLAVEMLDTLSPADLRSWGWTKEEVFAGLEAADGSKPPSPPRNRYTFQRSLMRALKKDIRTRPHGKIVKKIKYYCDVLLRE